MKDENNIFGIHNKTIIEFKEIYGLTFVFTSRITIINNKISSAEITPSGIIYKKDKEIYFSPLTKINNINEIVKKYVSENRTNLEEEYFHFEQ